MLLKEALSVLTTYHVLSERGREAWSFKIRVRNKRGAEKRAALTFHSSGEGHWRWKKGREHAVKYEWMGDEWKNSSRVQVSFTFALRGPSRSLKNDNRLMIGMSKLNVKLWKEQSTAGPIATEFVSCPSFSPSIFCFVSAFVFLTS
mmetsp:Transcript_18333/g.37128  ORF Transcript_18333/g.37128 Transcript_18333/m.37128 type:complete len:146 (+) Transcript_18333:452-889(+)